MCGVVDGGIVAGLLGLRGRPERRRRHLRLVRRPRRPGARTHEAAARPGSRVHEHLTELAAAAGGRRARPGRARLAQRQPLGARRPRAVRARSSARRWPPAPRTSTARCSRRPRSAPAMIVETFARQRRSGRASSSSPAGCRRTRCSCRSTPTSPRLPLSIDRLRAGPGARLGDPRRRRRRRLPRRAAPPPRRWAGAPRTSYVPDAGARRRLRPAVRRVRARCTTTSAAAATTSCTGSGAPPRGPDARVVRRMTVHR